jgi:hypothetical protein
VGVERSKIITTERLMIACGDTHPLPLPVRKGRRL